MPHITLILTYPVADMATLLSSFNASTVLTNLSSFTNSAVLKVSMVSRLK